MSSPLVRHTTPRVSVRTPRSGRHRIRTSVRRDPWAVCSRRTSTPLGGPGACGWPVAAVRRRAIRTRRACRREAGPGQDRGVSRSLATHRLRGTVERFELGDDRDESGACRVCQATARQTNRARTVDETDVTFMLREGGHVTTFATYQSCRTTARTGSSSGVPVFSTTVDVPVDDGAPRRVLSSGW